MVCPLDSRPERGSWGPASLCPCHSASNGGNIIDSFLWIPEEKNERSAFVSKLIFIDNVLIVRVRDYKEMNALYH